MKQQRSITVTTTFSGDGYSAYGHRFLASFLKYWPREISLRLYVEDFYPPKLPRNVILHDLLVDVPDAKAFLNRHRENQTAQGYRDGDAYWFRWDAYKFSRKVFAITHAGLSSKDQLLVWLDADVVTFDYINRNFFDALLPKGIYTAFLGRCSGPFLYTETGFLLFDLTHDMNTCFMRKLAAVYDDDEIFELDEWHDAWAFDYCRRQMAVPGKSLSTTAEGHVFINSPLGLYMDHCKGPRRKVEGRSKSREMIVGHRNPYWDQCGSYASASASGRSQL